MRQRPYKFLILLATGDSKRYPDQTLIAVEDYNYFISDFNFEAIRGKLMVGAA